MGRVEKSIKNAKTSTFSKLLNIILKFLVRTIFVYYLGTEYLGINGLFTNVLTILSFAELGIGEAIIFKLYKPIAEDDKEKVNTLLHFYKNVYIIIGITIFVIGLLIMPFITIFTGNDININENIYLIYMLFLLNTVISYFFTYKRSIIIANQDEYIISRTELIFNIFTSVFQITVLLVSRNYILYLLVQIIFTFLINIVVSYIANRKYRYIADKKYKKIEKNEKKDIFNNVKSIILYKIGYVLSNGTDNMIISKFLGVASVGLLSNYTIITTAFTSLLNSAFNSLTGSIGNLNTINDCKKKEKVFYELLYLSFAIYGTISTCLIVLLNKFILIWLGNEYILSTLISLALGLNFYIDGMRFVNYTFRNTLGLFKKGKYTPLISSITNVILSIILVNYWGVFGVLIATGLTRLFILTMYDPYIIHKYEFKSSSIKYYKKYFYYMFIFLISTVLCYNINKCINIGGILGFIICGAVDVIVTIMISIISTFKTKEYNSLKERFIHK